MTRNVIYNANLICYCPLRDLNWNKNIVLYCIVCVNQNVKCNLPCAAEIVSGTYVTEA